MFNPNYLLIAGAVTVIAIGQIAFKYAARNLEFVPGRTLVETVIANRMPIAVVGAAMALYFLSTIAWVQALRSVPLSIAYLFNALTFILVPTAAFVIFGENLPRFFILGAAMIVAGILLTTQG